MTLLEVRVTGRPAPQGSHEVGANNYVMHSSKYLEAWRHAVNRDTRAAYVADGIVPADVPLIPYPQPVSLMITHVVLDEQCRADGTDEPTGSPDDDKLLRATIDGLGEARVFTNDSQVTEHYSRKRRRLPGEEAGAYIRISSEPLSALADRGDQQVETFTPNGQYRLVLESVGTDSDGDRTWQTVFEVTDSPSAIAATWLPAVASRVGQDEASPAPAAAAEAPKAARKPRKAAAPAPEPIPDGPAEPETAPEPQVPAQPVRVNPFAKQS